MDDLIAETGVALRTLTMPSFMDNIAQRVGTIKENAMFFSPIDGDLELPSCATRDIASIEVRWLLDDTWSGQEDVAVLTGEHLLQQDGRDHVRSAWEAGTLPADVVRRL
ncbi:hypothetical protein ELI47_08500 [Rhizobium ruizarguesonis]|uniref:hypothetical protein n=1 Tax=Rhizobium ruizarguesonis TaxID=2081791 RepID=UPI0010316A17|nr:hypothetical protein [Rhizobium ruizarguesonis]TAU31126.1 hypothetical protein ELI47_08500 [Rhizobium ruizarguesonis]